ncbi:ABC transporter permease [Actinoplanes sp. NPDC000266]
MTTALSTSHDGRLPPPWRARLVPVADTAVRKLAGAAATVAIAALLVFSALSLTPGDPADQLVGQRATAAERAAARHELGLDQPFIVRFGHWLTDAVQGDLGRSVTYRQDVWRLIEPRIMTTLFLVAMAAVLITVIGVVTGTLGGISDRWRPLVSGLVGAGISIPAYVSASILIGVFAVKLGWFPTYGAGNGIVDRIYHLALPALALSLSWAAYVAQMTMTAVREEAGKEHVATAVGRGLSRAIVLRRHILRNASLPVMTASGLTIAGLVAGTVVVETAFGIDGIGSLLVKSVLNKDYQVVMAVSVLIVVVFVIVTNLLDIAQTVLDPRSRHSGGSR